MFPNEHFHCFILVKTNALDVLNDIFILLNITLCVQGVRFHLQSIFDVLYFHYFRVILVGFVILMILTDLYLCVDSAVHIPSSLAGKIVATMLQFEIRAIS